MMWCLQDVLRNNWMWVTISDSFASNLSIDNNWDRLDYPWIFIVPIPLSLYVESLLSKMKTSVFSCIDSICIVIQQTQTAESEILHTILPNWPLTLLQNSITTEYHNTRVSFRLVYHTWRFIFLYCRQQTQFEPIQPQELPLTKVPTLFSI